MLIGLPLSELRGGKVWLFPSETLVAYKHCQCIIVHDCDV